MVAAQEQRETKKALAEGGVDIVVGTHAVLGKAVDFKDLGLVVIDEEQHFGVAHKERLKELRAEVHILTLSATPIPRTLQLAMTGVRDLSIIATPPVDRLAVRTFVSPFDALIVREALLRERYRGGQSFYVCPRIEDLDEAAAFLRQNVPEAKFVTAHGQMAARELEDKIGAFYDGKYDILLSTAIVESGLDIPRANTLIVHRADMFGLGQLYQLRGRVGRAKLRAYAIFTTPAKAKITPQAEKRLEVLQSLDTLGAGFQLASHDLDLRGAGNLLGEEQSGHIKEVGYELYQQMVREAVERIKSGEDAPAEDIWSPTIQLGAPVTIPEIVYCGSADPACALPPPLGARGRGRDRRDGRRDYRPLRPAAARSRAPDEARADQGALPQGECRKARRRREGRDARLPQQCVRQPDRAGEMGDEPRLARPRAAGHAHRGGRRLREARRPAGRDAEDHAGDREACGEEGVGTPLSHSGAQGGRRTPAA